MLKKQFINRCEKEKRGRLELVKKAFNLTVCALAALFVLLVVALIIDLAAIKVKYTLEAGDPLPSSDKLSGKKGTEYDFGDYDGRFDSVGKYDFYILDGRRKIKVKLTVVDTKAPEATPISLSVNKNGPYPEAVDFFEDIYDASEYSAKLLSQIDFSALGEGEVRLELGDVYGNSKKYTARLSVVEDNTPPTISAPATITTYLGEPAAYTKGVTVSDNCFGEVALSVNTDGVNASKAGSYRITYTAKDAAGNTSSAAVTLVILERRITREELMAKIEALATALEITAELETEEKCRLIYGYVNSPTASASNATVVFTDESNTDRTDWIREAYLTLERGAGDCYSYFALSKAFFEYFGIENRDIERAKGVTTQSGTHFWSLVNVGTKSAPEWYYFDATRLASKHKTGSGCLFTEAQLIDYNTKVKVGFLTYDHTGYPKASEKTINEGYTW